MIFVTKATISDLPMLTKIDSKIIGNESRKSKIEKYIKHEQCYVASHNGTFVGFACCDTTFSNVVLFSWSLWILSSDA